MSSVSAPATSDPRKAAWQAVLVAFLLLWPFLPFLPHSFRTTFLGDAILAMSYAIVAASLVLLTGWVAQISLAQASFVGVGAFVTGIVVRTLGLPFPLSLPVAACAAALAAAGLGLVALRVRGLYLAVATLIFAWMTDSFLFLQSWMLGGTGSSSIEFDTLGVPGTIPHFDFTSRRAFYYIMLAATAATLFALANVRDSKSGRAFFAVRGSEVAAASLGVDVTRTKLVAFAFSGFLAGVAGNLQMTHNLVASPDSFGVEVSLFFLAVAVVGGLTSLGGAVAAGILFAGLSEVFFRFEFLTGLLEIVSAVLLAVVLLFFPKGLAGLPQAVRDWARRSRDRLGDLDEAALTVEDEEAADEQDEDVDGEPVVAEGDAAPARLKRLAARPARRAVGWLADRLARAGSPAAAAPDALEQAYRPRATGDDDFEPDEPEETVGDGAAAPVPATPAGPSGNGSANGTKKLEYVPGTASRPELPPREERTPLLQVRDVTVTFGGLTAVDDAHLEVREGEIVGLIGPNGAGKTTMFNAIAGLNEPDTGHVAVYGQDVRSLDVHERARMGIGRTFQVIQLFPQLDVFDNLLVATHLRNDTGFFQHLAVTPKAIAAESSATERVHKVLDLLNLHEHAHRGVAELPFGILRMIEVARALVTGSPVIMLDEPASGLDNTETDRLADLLFWIRETLGVSMLLIEHDVRMVTGVSDYMYVLNRGAIIGEGTPEEVQSDQAVIDAYLGAEISSGEQPSGAPVEVS